MNTADMRYACPDCGGETREVTLFGRGPANPVSRIAIDSAVVHYAKADATRTWTAMFKPEGSVHTMMCQGCGRISMYGLPAAAGEQAAIESIHCLQCGNSIEPGEVQCEHCGWTYTSDE